MEKLTHRQGRRMSRASIQDKLSGTSGLKMVQVLALVRACADYAHSIGAPLPPEDVDEQIWQEKVAHLRAPINRRAVEPPDGDPKATQDRKTGEPSDLEELIPPLINAGMDDISNIARQGAGQPLETWLPTVVVALGHARMDYQGFLNMAAQAPPGQIVKILESIADDGPEDVGNRYFQTCLLTQHPAEIPKLLVALRRADGELSLWYAHNFVDAILGKGDWPGGTRSDLADVLRALRGATLKEDADKLAENIGMHAWPKIALATAGAIPESFLGDRELILHAGSQGGPHRLLRLIDCLKREQFQGLESHRALHYLLTAVPAGKHADFSLILNDAGMKSEAQRLLEMEKEAPF
ncbi:MULTISPECIES: hypothetical protein [unclassified Streptomyces]|uniref:hypothetical protein n=1 Tax=unclassified Streptomyces TaxID=2593676 RepID=UPI00136A037D|nr:MULTISPECIES: hypothetical protein [unclassified Streptomyces]MYT70369.1 hypothetical protein [Streptomyces sp. SID8367]